MKKVIWAWMLVMMMWPSARAQALSPEKYVQRYFSDVPGGWYFDTQGSTLRLYWRSQGSISKALPKVDFAQCSFLERVEFSYLGDGGIKSEVFVRQPALSIDTVAEERKRLVGYWQFDFTVEYTRPATVDQWVLDKVRREGSYCGLVKYDDEMADYANFLTFFTDTLTWQVPGVLRFLIFDPKILTRDVRDWDLEQFCGWFLSTARAQLALRSPTENARRQVKLDRGAFLFWCGQGDNPDLLTVRVLPNNKITFVAPVGKAIVIVSFHPSGQDFIAKR